MWFTFLTASGVAVGVFSCVAAVELRDEAGTDNAAICGWETVD
jgi:hypothetical protein